jgi:tetratricopeptide (TPR) repeat protein
MDDPELKAKCWIKRGIVAQRRGEPKAALAAQRCAESLLAPERSPRLYFCAQNNLVLCEISLGRFAEAERRLEVSRRFFLQVDDPLSAPILSWLEARIARGLGRTAEAIDRLAATRDTYLNYGLGYDAALVSSELAQVCSQAGRRDDAERHLHFSFETCLEFRVGMDAALVSLDLADLYRETGRTADVKQLARAVEPIFRCQDVGREATAALILFQRAARAERLTAAFVTRLRGLLDRSRRNGNTAAAGAG